MKNWIIEKLNKNPDYCWANLVMWSLGYRSFWSLFFKNHIENDYKDFSCTEKDGSYCGKCLKKGRLKN